jgi:hypothetical protein
MRSGGAHCRTKGHDYERLVASEFRAHGFTNAQTSRVTNLAADAAGIDLQGIEPFHVQCKCKKVGVNYAAILAAMPDVQGRYNVIFSKITPRKGEYVIMPKAAFYELLTMLKSEGIL